MRWPCLILAGAMVTVLSACGDGFDADVWRGEAGNWQRENARASMVGALHERLVPGTPRDEVRALLGAPDTVETDKDIYVIGRAAYGVDFEMLAITYDGSARVVSLTLRRS